MSSRLKTLLEPCAATIECESEERAKRVALNEYSNRHHSDRFILWSDSSHRKQGNGIAVVWRAHHDFACFSHKVFVLDPKFDNNIAEFFAVSEAMKLAWQNCQANIDIAKVVIYTDSQAALFVVRDFHKRLPSHRARFCRQLELVEIKEQCKELSAAGIKIIFRWVPGHSMVPGNMHADYLAGKVSSDASPLARFDNIHYTPHGYIETPPIIQQRVETEIERRGPRQAVRYGRIEKIVVSRRTPAKRLYASRIIHAIQTMETEFATHWLDIVDEAINEQLKKE